MEVPYTRVEGGDGSGCSAAASRTAWSNVGRIQNGGSWHCSRAGLQGRIAGGVSRPLPRSNGHAVCSPGRQASRLAAAAIEMNDAVATLKRRQGRPESLPQPRALKRPGECGGARLEPEHIHQKDESHCQAQQKPEARAPLGAPCIRPIACRLNAGPICMHRRRRMPWGLSAPPVQRQHVHGSWQSLVDGARDDPAQHSA
eukprot:scaffold12045_cov109-Isochrysis_galbana.AAC.3